MLLGADMTHEQYVCSRRHFRLLDNDMSWASQFQIVTLVRAYLGELEMF